MTGQSECGRNMIVHRLNHVYDGYLLPFFTVNFLTLIKHKQLI